MQSSQKNPVTEDYLLEVVHDLMEDLPQEAKKPWFEACVEFTRGNKQPLEEMMKWRWTPVDIVRFVEDPFYMNLKKDVYPKVLEGLVELFHSKDHKYVECVLGGGIGWGKSQTKSTTYVDSLKGERRSVADLLEGETLSVTENGRLEDRPYRSKVSGFKECLKVELAGGQWVELTVDHPVLTQRGWVESQNLQLESDLVATPRWLPPPQKTLQIEEGEVRLTAYLLADASFRQGRPTLTKAVPEILHEVANLLEEYGKGASVYELGSTKSGKRLVKLGLNGLRGFAKKWNLGGFGKKGTYSKDKRLPANFYGLSDKHTALFLNRFWACDGNVYIGRPAKIEIALASEGLIDDLRYLLLRLKILSRKVKLKKSYISNGEKLWADAWRLSITSAPEIIKFLERVGPVLGKEEACLRLMSFCKKVNSNPNTDLVPIGVKELKEIGASKKWGLVEGSWMGRARFERLVKETGYSGRLAWLATSDLCWNGIKSLTKIGKHTVYDLSIDEDHNFIANGIVVHNTTFSNCAVAYMLYVLSCMRNPARTYNLARGSKIVIVLQSITERKAKDAVFFQLKTLINSSPYFQKYFQPEKRENELRFVNSIWVTPVSGSDSGAISENVYGGHIDESNFMAMVKYSKRMYLDVGGGSAYDQAKENYHAIIERMRSRFMVPGSGEMPGKLIISSSARHPDDFTERKMMEAEREKLEDKPRTILVLRHAQWETKEGYRNSKRFKIMTGDRTHRPRIIEENEKIETVYGEIIAVPEEFKRPFEQNISRAVREVAGIPLQTISAFLVRREAIHNAIERGKIRGMKHPFNVLEGTASELKFLPDLLVKHDYWCAAHLDLGRTRDCTGLAIGHVEGLKSAWRGDSGASSRLEQLPHFVMDVILRITHPVNDETIFADVRGLIYDMVDAGLKIRYVTADAYQSADSLQIFRERGFITGNVSVVRTQQPYIEMKSALYEDRLDIYDYPTFIKEASDLEENNVTGKIDHPPSGSKDTSDSVASVIHVLGQRRESWGGSIIRRDYERTDFTRPEISRPKVDVEAPNKEKESE